MTLALGVLSDVAVAEEPVPAEQLPAVVARMRPDVVVMLTPGRGGMTISDFANALSRVEEEAGPDTAIVIISAQTAVRLTDLPNPERPRAYLASIDLVTGECVTNAVRSIREGNSVISARYLTTTFDHGSQRSPLSALTAQQLDVLRLVADGQSNQAIADALCLTAKSVEGLVTTIFRALDLDPDDKTSNRRVQAAVIYLRETAI